MRAPVSRMFCVAVFAAALSACAPGANLPPMPPYANATYKLGPGDQIRIITFGSEELTGPFNLDDTGNVAMPLIGNVPAAGLSTDAFAARLKQKMLDGGFLRNPSVAVQVAVYRPISVLGEVLKPGQYPFQPGMTMLTAVAAAGGFTYRAVEDYAADIRNVDGQAVEGKIFANSFLAPGDVVKIYERHF